MTAPDFCVWLLLVVRPLVTRPEQVTVGTVYSSDTKLALQVKVEFCDRGRVIGRAGETIGALRALVAAVGGRLGLRVSLDLADEARRA